MSVGAAYTNTFQGPCAGVNYRWVPPTAANMSGPDFTQGYGPLIIDRGKFRNYYVPKDPSNKANISVAIGSGATSIGNPYAPIINSTRPVTLAFAVAVSKNQNIVIYPKGSNNLIIFSGLTSISGNLSSIQVTYDLSMYVGDATINSLFNLSPAQQAALSSMQSIGVNPTDLESFLTGLSPIPVVLSDNKNTSYPAGLQLTRLRTSITESNLNFVANSAVDSSQGPFFKKQLIKIKNEQKDRNVFPSGVSDVTFSAAPGFENSSLCLVMKKVMFFTADRVNFENGQGVGNTQLPCNAIGYSMYVNGFFFPQLAVASVAVGVLEAGAFSNALMWPQDARPSGPDVHVKVFCPDYLENSPGFAHSLNLHILIVSFPVFGAFGSFLLPGVNQPWFIIVIGPLPFVKQYTFVGTSKVSNISLQTVCISSSPYKINSGTVTLQQNSKTVANFNIETFSNIVNNQSNFYNNYEYNAKGTTSTTAFVNVYTNEIGIQVNSNPYKGSPQRSTVYLNAYDTLASSKYTPLNSSYQSYINFNENPNLYKLFTESEPCLIFNLQFQAGNSSNVFQEGGFYSAIINCSANDTTNLFDTKLVYRVYAADPNGDFDPRNNLKYTMKIGFDKTFNTTPPYIQFTNFDNSWDFSNVLVTPNLKNVMQLISSEIMIDSIQGGFTSKFNFPPVNLNLFCAVYAYSQLSDIIKNYDVSSYSSLNFPVVNFEIDSNFVISLPIYTVQSYQNGGNLNAIKDYGYVGKYTLDTNSYTVYNQYFSGKNFDNKNPYTGIFNSSDGYYNLLTMSYETPTNQTTTAFDISYNAGSPQTPSVTEVDFTMDLQYLLTNIKIDNTPSWELDIDLKNNPSFLKYKYEIDYVNATTYELIYKIIDSGLTNSQTINTKITIPFYLGSVTGVFIFKFFIYNYQAIPGTLSVNSIKLVKNTINFFSFTTNQTTHGVPITYYEDLPIQPTSYLGGCNSFLLYLDSPSGNAAIFDPTVGYQITGAIRSPTWVVDLTDNLEVDYRGIINDSLFPVKASGVQPYKLYFRTGIANNVKVIDSKKHKSSSLIVTMTNNNTLSSDHSIKQIVSESYARFLRQISTVKTVYENGYLQDLQLQYPVMSGNDELLIQGQTSEFQNLSTISLNMEGPGNYIVQPNFVQNFSPVDNPSYVRVKLQNCLVTAFDTKNDKTFTAGITANNNLIYIEDAVISQNAATQFRLIEGDPNSSNSKNDLNNPNVTVDNTKYFGLVNVSYPGILITKNDDVIILYVYSQQLKSANYNIIPGSAIYYRIVNGAKISDPYLLFSFNILSSNNSFPSINQISVAHTDTYEFGREYYLAFDCYYKIFFMKLLYDQQNLNYTDLSIIYGNLNSSSTKDKIDVSFINSINQLISVGAINKLNLTAVDSLDVYGKNLDSTQRVGVVDFDGFYVGVQFIKNGNVYEVVFDKSFTINGEVRQIDN